VKGGARRFAASGERSKPKEWGRSEAGRPERSRADSSHGEPRTEPPSEAAEPIPASGMAASGRRSRAFATRKPPASTWHWERNRFGALAR